LNKIFKFLIHRRSSAVRSKSEIIEKKEAIENNYYNNDKDKIKY
jgi:hypothetical protein